jgi:hypothetical protein
MNWETDFNNFQRDLCTVRLNCTITESTYHYLLQKVEKYKELLAKYEQAAVYLEITRLGIENIRTACQMDMGQTVIFNEADHIHNMAEIFISFHQNGVVGRGKKFYWDAMRTGLFSHYLSQLIRRLFGLCSSCTLFCISKAMGSSQTLLNIISNWVYSGLNFRNVTLV